MQAQVFNQHVGVQHGRACLQKFWPQTSSSPQLARNINPLPSSEDAKLLL